MVRNMVLCALMFFYVGEADLVIHHLKALLSAGVSPGDIAVIAPYNLQVRHIADDTSSLHRVCVTLPFTVRVFKNCADLCGTLKCINFVVKIGV